MLTCAAHPGGREIHVAEKHEKRYPAETRTIYDLARFPLLEIAALPDNYWVVAAITPDACGMTIDARRELDEEGMELVRHDQAGRRATEYVVYGGTVTVLAVLGREPKCALRYEEAIRPGSDSYAPGVAREIFDVFNGRGGCVVCQVNDGYAGRSRYSPALLIPAQWTHHCESAVHFVREHPEAFPVDPSARQITYERLQKLCNDPNPFLAISAFKRLSDNDTINIEEASKLVATSKFEVQGALALIMLRKRAPALHPVDRTQSDVPLRIDARLHALSTVVASANDFKMIRGIALASLARYHVPPRGDPMWGAGHLLADALVDAANRTADLSAEDKELAAAIEGWANPAHLLKK